MAHELSAGLPAWAEEVAGTVTVHSQFVLYGNIRDRFLVAPYDELPKPIIDVLWTALRPSGYQCLIVSDQVDGVRVFPDEPDRRRIASGVVGDGVIGRKATLEELRNIMARVAGVPEPPPITGNPVQEDGRPAPARPVAGPSGDGGESAAPPDRPAAARPRIAFVLDFASRLARSRELAPDEHAFFLFSQKLAVTANRVPGGAPNRPVPVFNPIIWLTDGERDLPAWFTAGIEQIRRVAVPLPSLDDRLRAAPLFAQMLTLTPTEKELDTYARATDQMTLHAMEEVARVARDRSIALADIKDAARIYRLGVEQNPWRKASVRKAILAGEEEIPRYVFGQPAAIKRTLDILKRASLGLSGAQATSTGTRPKGLLFFAGPTGVGKTELAKRVAKLIFGDESSYLRFDMSEFAQSHAAERLTGAPPGYVGYEAGGQLTGAVRRNPFQVILFDEIEKAHPQVMDKFLQILEDGRLTDGQGTTTYFSECVLIFTSNLGIYTRNKQTGERTPRVKPGIDYTELEKSVTEAIREHFTYEIGRPELLNRIGDNIVVFNFIDESAALQILKLQIDNVRERVRRELQITVDVGDAAQKFLHRECTADEVLAHGGRGIGNKLESRFINPLAGFLFDENCPPGAHVTVHDIRLENGVARLEASVR